ncbi:HAMP domain-containing sensor histidine kinase [Ureibacillus chungkukjangi]|uniref:histidine kinase n=1 Tax=Ureibacillus chungkukjangi TaxID=1202712 RepID=A0A318TIC5_9BACL|nr:HAMP domain-containing sensor histidine kinase [Ureibacillus chungkukjangi]MCM3390048.1 ATP-binding protein [Ureibacillus chungkukjangi]PYF03677.1 histidine kinase/DNA gyrase B/HSP90-like ATPase [Ureibacillus chungkukjangi]
MKAKSKLLLILFLITWSALAVVTFINHSHNYLFKSYFEAGEFQSTKDAFIEKLEDYVLVPFDADKAKGQLNVSVEEIENYRNYYGSLTEQIENIRYQYIDQITQAEEAKDTELKEVLVAERDTKIADIKKNFESNEYVEEKIRKLKEEAVNKYAAEQKRERQDFINEYSYFGYRFENIDTGEIFESGSQQSSNLYQEEFNSISALSVNNTFHINNFGNNYMNDEIQIDVGTGKFIGTIYITKSMLKNTNFANEYESYKVAQIIFYIVWITGVLAIVGLFTFARPSRDIFKGEYDNLQNIYLRAPIDVQVVLMIVAITVLFAALDSLGYTIRNLFYYSADTLSISFDFLVFLLVSFLSLFVVIMGSIWTWNSANTEEKMKKQVKQAMLYRLADGMRDLFLNRSIGMQAVGIMIVAFLSGVGFVGAGVGGGELVVIYILLLFFIALPATLVFLRRMGYLNRIMKQTEEMAAGRLTTEIKVKGKSVFAKHAANLNDLREGVRNSMTEQAKSERMKTELITNVSHDLRTPLTSIITYTDLLKNPNLTEEERKQYIDVLDKKSARLKTLIEDLFEVSKMASGNIEITKQRLDLTQLLKQSIGEHEEEFAKSNFDLRVLMPEQPLFAYVDGQKMWRVIDNLIVNALKYSLEGTRIYITLKQSGSSAEFTVKNISKYELDENVDELTERFKRADASRHTDGSGLGLAIAQSIADLHNGRLSIDVDGDLFKVTVSVPAEY